MISRVAIPLLLLPLLALALPLMFAWAWIQEAIVERSPLSRPDEARGRQNHSKETPNCHASSHIVSQ
jgi:hypothetical protein